MYTRNKRILLHLSLVGPLGPASIFRFLSYLCHQAKPELLHIGWDQLLEHEQVLMLEQIYTYSPTQLVQIMRLKPDVAAQVHQELADTRLLDEELALIAKHNIVALTPFDADYPAMLKQIHYPPLVVYCRGVAFDVLAKGIAIVGSRKADSYGRTVINEFVPSLVEHGWSIVSGGAEGADTMAHQAALAVGGKTVAVLGAGLLAPAYPVANAPLFDAIVQQGGLVVSPFSLRRGHDRTTFPMRNRIISGLSYGSIVVQAAERSGALITARFALEQGRQVFAVPGQINDPLSYGSHYLIKQGAKLVASAVDILEEFGYVAPAALAAQPTKKKIQAAQLQLQSEAAQDPLLATLREPATLDELHLVTGLQADELQDTLFALQLEGKIKQHFSGTWQRV
jgi:DNA processing protein